MKNQIVTKESDARASATHSRPIRHDESDIAARLREVMGDEPLLSFARRCGVGETTLRKYLEGAEPSTRRLVAIADTAGVNIAWLAAGRGPKKGSAAPAQAASIPPLNTDLLQAAIEGVQEGLQRINRTVPPDRHAQLIAAAYELLLDSQGHVSKNNVINFIRAAA